MFKLWHFIRRDYVMEVAYKAKFASDLFYLVFTVVLYYYLSKLVGAGSASMLQRYECDYFSFVMVGVALANLLQAALQGYTENVRRFMVEGSLEAMFVSPTPHHVAVLYSAAWPVLYATLKTLLQLGTAMLLFGLRLDRLDLGGTIVSLCLTVALFGSIGVVSASLLIVIKRGDPLNWVFLQLSHIFGGVLFPVEMLPPWGQMLSYLFPVRYALDAARKAMLVDASVTDLVPELSMLGLFCAISIPASLYASSSLIMWAKQRGALASF